jgi:hypothetical protein
LKVQALHSPRGARRNGEHAHANSTGSLRGGGDGTRRRTAGAAGTAHGGGWRPAAAGVGGLYRLEGRPSRHASPQDRARAARTLVSVF